MSLRRRIADLANRPIDRAAAITRGTANAMGYTVSTSSIKYLRTSGRGAFSYLNRTRYDYQQEVGDASTNSAVVAVVQWVARNFPEAPVRVARVPKNDTSPVTYVAPRATGPGRMLELLERPNPFYSGVLQWMATITDILNTGNGYWLKLRGPNGRVEQLWWLPSWMTEPAWDERRNDQFIGWYEYKVDGVTYAYRPEDIIHFREGIDKNNTRKGLSPLAALYREVFTDDEASNMTASLMKNIGVPGVVLSPANTTGPTGRFKDPDDMKEKFMEKFSGDKTGEPFVASVPVDLKVASWSPNEMNLRDLRKIPEERISAVFGVAAIVAGLGAGLDRSTFNNFSEARKAAYQESIIPRQRLMSAELEIQLLDEFAVVEDYDVDFDWKQATAMSENTNEVWRRNQEAATKGLITRADFKRAIGQPVGPDDEVYLVPNNFLFVEPGDTPQDEAETTKPDSGLVLPSGNGIGPDEAHTEVLRLS